MRFSVLSVLHGLSCTLVVFSPFADAIGAVPVFEAVSVARRPVPVAPTPLPIVPKILAAEAVAPRKLQLQNRGISGGGGGGKGGSGSGGSGRGGKGGSRSGNRNGGSRNGDHTLPQLRPLPHAGDEISIEDDASVFSLGSFVGDEDGTALFEHFDERSRAFYSKMYDFFAAKEDYLATENAYAEATGTQDPFDSGYQDRPTGQPLRITRKATSPTEHEIIAKFTPTAATDVCKAWSTLRSYCGSAGRKCACYSGTYYVPDQWNSLADGCASVTTRCGGTDIDDDVWCRFGSTAYDYNTYCLDSDGEAPSAMFAKSANGGTSTQDSNPTTGDSDPAPNAGSTADPASDEPHAISEEPVATEVTFTSIAPAINPAETTAESSTIYSFFPWETTSALTPTDSWSSRLVDPICASTFAWLSLLTTMILL